VAALVEAARRAPAGHQAVDAVDHVQVEVVVHARVDDGHVGVDPPVGGGADAGGGVVVAERAADAGGHVLVEQLVDRVLGDVGDPVVLAHGLQLVRRQLGGVAGQRVRVDVGRVEARLLGMGLDGGGGTDLAAFQHDDVALGAPGRRRRALGHGGVRQPRHGHEGDGGGQDSGRATGSHGPPQRRPAPGHGARRARAVESYGCVHAPVRATCE
jgi:hypothetical protein